MTKGRHQPPVRHADTKVDYPPATPTLEVFLYPPLAGLLHQPRSKGELLANQHLLALEMARPAETTMPNPDQPRPCVPSAPMQAFAVFRPHFDPETWLQGQAFVSKCVEPTKSPQIWRLKHPVQHTASSIPGRLEKQPPVSQPWRCWGEAKGYPSNHPQSVVGWSLPKVLQHASTAHMHPPEQPMTLAGWRMEPIAAKCREHEAAHLSPLLTGPLGRAPQPYEPNGVIWQKRIAIHAWPTLRYWMQSASARHKMGLPPHIYPTALLRPTRQIRSQTLCRHPRPIVVQDRSGESRPAAEKSSMPVGCQKRTPRQQMTLRAGHGPFLAIWPQKQQTA